ncbi:tetratricopeptide repeat protein [Tenacibaculum sp. M341]|uniref:tetratricopeptide repeat protein n=1 Tax=Tenacibaculum sp. M341 TaxID=2530339 RepID=UPI00105247F8|nr:hypothetical protein [Tenacibaculum sp. M341]TCI92233.1 hypothetical protein EYW44_08610 [Tenacibaculum sp. M341]
MKVYFFKVVPTALSIKKHYFLWALLLFKVCTSFSQKGKHYKQIDSLIKLSKKDRGKFKLLKKAYDLSSTYNYTRGKIASSNFIGEYYLHFKQYDSAFYYLEKANELIEKKQKFKRFFKKVLTNKAKIFAKKGFYTRALFLYRKAYKVSLNNKMKDTLLLKLNIFKMFNELGKHERVIERLTELEGKFIRGAKKNKLILSKYYLTLSEGFKKNKDFSNALKVINKNITKLKGIQYKKHFHLSLLKKAELYLLSDSLKKAKNILITFLKEYKPKTDKESLVQYYKLKGKLHCSFNKFSISNSYYDSLISISYLEPKVLASAYKSKFYNYRNLNKIDEANASILSYMLVNDSLQKVKDKDILSYYNSDLRFVKERKHKNELTIKNKKQQLNIIILSLVLVCVLSFLIILLIYKKYSKSKTEIKELKINEKKILEDHIKLREEELIITASSIKEQNEKIKSIKKLLKEAIKNNDYKNLNGINNSLDSLLDSSSGISLIYEKLESRYPNLAIILKNNYPHLSANDIKHCLLLKLNLSIKDCSQLLNVSDHAIKMARKRIKKKMELPEEVRLKEFLNDL